MPSYHDAWLRHQQSRWLRPDAVRWVRPDAARFLAPGTDVAKAFPPRARKYNPNQPRVPSGNSDGGQWTDGTAASDTSDLGLFQIAPSDNTIDGIQLAGELPPSVDPGVPSDEPPEIPPGRPGTSTERTAFLRTAASWLVRNPGLAADIYTGTMNNVEWLRDYHDVIQAARDEPKSFEELQASVGLKRPGYDDHHVVEQTLAERFGFSRSQIDDPSNRVSIPRLTHYQITGWYGTPSPDYGGLSPREYLRDKDWDTRRQIGLDALVRFKVLQP